MLGMYFLAFQKILWDTPLSKESGITTGRQSNMKLFHFHFAALQAIPIFYPKKTYSVKYLIIFGRTLHYLNCGYGEILISQFHDMAQHYKKQSNFINARMNPFPKQYQPKI
jgi:hypothetical protein